MESTHLVLDPDGDVVLVVEIPHDLEEAEEPISLEAQPALIEPPKEDISPSPSTKTFKKKGKKGKKTCVRSETPPPPNPPSPTPPLRFGFEPTSEEEPRTEETPASANEPPPWDDGVADNDTPPKEEHVADESFGESSHDIGRPKIRMRVSSSHLRLASPYFKRMFQSGRPEGDALRAEGRAEVHLQNDEDPKALLILLNIIHGHTRTVPRSVDLRMLTKIAILVDFFECYETIEVFSDMWINVFKDSLPQSIGKDLTRWIWISWVFNNQDQFKAVTRIAERQSTGPIETHGFPIPDIVIGQYSPFLEWPK